MGNTASTTSPKLRRLSRASISSTSSHTDKVAPPPVSAPPKADAELLDLDEFDDESLALPSLPLRSAGGTAGARRHSEPTPSSRDEDEEGDYIADLELSAERRAVGETDTLCDSASIMTSFTDAPTLCEGRGDPLPAYAAGSSIVSSAVAEAMTVLNENAKGWRRDVALRQLEWLAADGTRRARWVLAEARARRARAKRRRSSLGAVKERRKSGGEDMRLSVAGEERCRAEDLATARRVAMERQAGEVRALKEEAARQELERAHEVARAHTGSTGAEEAAEGEAGMAGGEEEGQAAGGEAAGDASGDAGPQPNGSQPSNETDDHALAFRAERETLRAAEKVYHETCAAAQEEHAAALAHAATAHERAWSATKVQYMGARLRDPDGPGGEVTFTAASGGVLPTSVGGRKGSFSGQYKVGRWGR